MGSDAAVVVGELTSLPPLKTAYKPAENPPKAAAAAEANCDREECVTPTSEEHQLKPATVCPPAPRKPRPAKRTAELALPPTKKYLAVRRDLSSIFNTLPPKKRIRVV